MNRNGSAMLAALWLLALLAAIGHWGFRELEDDIRAAMNRINLTKAAWARDACLEIAKGDFRDLWASTMRNGTDEPRQLTMTQLRQLDQDSIALAEGVWCRMIFTDVNARLNPNMIDSSTVNCLVEEDDLVSRWINHRPHASVEALAQTLALDSARVIGLRDVVSVYSTGSLNVNTASAQALACAIGVSEASVRAVIHAREQYRGFVTVEDALAAIPIADRPLHTAIVVPLTTSVIRFVVNVSGTAGQPPVHATATVQGTTSDHRMLIFQREAE